MGGVASEARRGGKFVGVNLALAIACRSSPPPSPPPSPHLQLQNYQSTRHWDGGSS